VVKNRMNPKVCPVCGSDSIAQILCDTLLSAHFRGMACPSEGVVAYHCDGSHVFLVLRNDFRWGEPVSAVQDPEPVPEKSASLAGFIKEQIARKFVAPGPGTWLSLSTVFGRGRKLQSLSLCSDSGAVSKPD
jgi:hypothetical protein